MPKGMIAIVLASLAIAACATPDASGLDVKDKAAEAARDLNEKFKKPEDSSVADPFEPFNRAMYAFNNGVDDVVLGPVSRTYERVVPKVGRDRVRDFVDNWKNPVWLANDLLQGDFQHAGVTSRRFAINTTVGVLGVYDFAAAHAGLEKRDEDFGQTLGVYGLENGPYLMLPIFGPTTLRDLAGTVVDTTLDPLTWTQFDGKTAYQVTSRAADVIDIRVRTDPAIRAVNESVDPYSQARALYIQNRAARVRNGVDSYEDLPSFE